MNKDAYRKWAMDHVYAFGLGESGEVMATAWFRIFDGFGYSVDELRAATFTIAKAPPQFPSEHLARINGAIAEARADRSRRGDEPTDRGTCTTCGNAGWVTVPHPRHVRNGVWQERHTAAVVCGCWFGRRIIEANANRAAEAKRGEEPKKPMTLEEYVRLNPNWREQLREYDLAMSECAREIGPRRGEESNWTKLDDAIDRALVACRRGHP